MVCLHEVFTQANDILHQRFQKKVHTTEDSVRYIFFHFITNRLPVEPNDIILEYPHTTIPRAEIDMHIPQINSEKGLTFEFKYDRKIPSGRNSPRPQKAGKIFADLFRLNSFEANITRKIFVYLTDIEMHSYFINKKNQLSDFYNLQKNGALPITKEYLSNKSDTFIKNVGQPKNRELKVKKLFDSKLCSQHWLKSLRNYQSELRNS